MQVKYQKYRGQEARYPIKLLYTSNMPLVLQSALVANLYMISQLIQKRSASNTLVRLYERQLSGGSSRMTLASTGPHLMSPLQGDASALTGSAIDIYHTRGVKTPWYAGIPFIVSSSRKLGFLIRTRATRVLVLTMADIVRPHVIAGGKGTCGC